MCIRTGTIGVRYVCVNIYMRSSAWILSCFCFSMVAGVRYYTKPLYFVFQGSWRCVSSSPPPPPPPHFLQFTASFFGPVLLCVCVFVFPPPPPPPLRARE